MRHAARVDANQAEIVAFMRSQGASVWIIGLPVDLLVGVQGADGIGRTALVEVKTLTGKRKPKPSKHTQLQKDFILDWEGGIVATITDLEGARHLLATMRGE